MKWSNTFGYLKPMGPNKTLFKYIINADPQFEIFPSGIMDWALRTVTGGALSYL